MAEELDEETLALAHRVFDLALSGERDALAGLVEAGVRPTSPTTRVAPC